MTSENQPATEPTRSNWNRPERESHMERVMSGPGKFEAGDDDYLEPGETAAIDEMDAMMDQYLDQMAPDVNTGQLLKVPVVAIKNDTVLVDVGDKSEGFINIREFPIINGQPQVKLGDMIEVVVKGSDPESGMLSLSYREARRRKAWEEAEDAFKNRKPLKGIISRTVKGGLILDIGTTAFLPASQIDLKRIENFDEWIGREVEGYVIEFTPEKRRIIISRRQMLEEEREGQRRRMIDNLTVGQTIDVGVKRVVEFGAFVDLGGIDGLIPRSEISWQRNARPDEYMKQGERIEARVIEIDQESGKVTLSRRQAMENPWDNVHETMPIGATIRGTIVSVTNYGAFVRLSEGLDGMIHISDMAWDAVGRKPGEYVEANQEVEAQVLSIDRENHRISLGLKQLTSDPWAELEVKYPRGSHVNGKVTGLTKYGAFVELEPGVEGMVHVSDFSWEKRIAQPRDMVKKGDEIEAVVLEINREKRRLSLGIKQLSESPRERIKQTYNNGDLVEGDVSKVTEFGVFITLGPAIEGFMHVSQLDSERVKSPADIFKVGDRVTAKITKIDPETGKISLSRKQMMKDQERKVVQQYMKTQPREAFNTLRIGDLLDNLQLDDDLPPEARRAAEPARTPPPSPAAIPAEAPPTATFEATPAPEPLLHDEMTEAHEESSTEHTEPVAAEPVAVEPEPEPEPAPVLTVAAQPEPDRSPAAAPAEPEPVETANPDLPQTPSGPSQFPENTSGKPLEPLDPEPNPENNGVTPDETAPRQTLPANGDDPTPDTAHLPEDVKN